MLFVFQVACSSASILRPHECSQELQSMFDDAKRSMVRRLGAVASFKVTIVFSQCVQNLPYCSPYCSYSRCKKKVPIHINPILYPKKKKIVNWHIFQQSPPFQWQVQLSSAAVAILERMPLGGSCWELLVNNGW